MTARAVLFAITDSDLSKLEMAKTDRERINYVQEVIEDRWEPGFVYELDKAWDALHRSLTDGRLEFGNGAFPLNAAVLGPVRLTTDDSYIITLTPRDMVTAVAEAVARVTDADIQRGYRSIDRSDYGPEYGEEDLSYTLGWFKELPAFWKNAAAAGRSVIFTVDQ